jgi:glycine oxidase
VKTWDVIIIGGGIIGLSLAIALRKRGATVLVVERGEPGREASHAAAGMLADCSLELAPAMQALAAASAHLYLEFVHELQDESGIEVDLRSQGALLFSDPHHRVSPEFTPLPQGQITELEPSLGIPDCPVFFLGERSVDPRCLATAALRAAKHREVDVASGTVVKEVLISAGRVIGVTTERSTYTSAIVVNCAGAWSGLVPPFPFPTRPVKGQMLSVVGGPKLQHVVRSPQVYLVPRTDGRIVIGATVEEAGYDKRTDPDTIQRLHRAAIALAPTLGNGKILEAWAGLRPATPDNLPILGETQTPGYFVATGHFRDGILLAPVTAQVMAHLVLGENSGHDLSAFSPSRFSNTG